MKTLRIPAIGSLMQRDPTTTISSFTKDQFFDNCFPELSKNPVTDKVSVYLTKRHGLLLQTAVTSASAGLYGATIWTGGPNQPPNIITSARKSGVTSTMILEAGVQIGSDIPNTSSCAYIDETVINATPHLTASLTDSSDGSVEAWYRAHGGAWTQVTSAPVTSVALCPDHCHMDGYQFFMTQDGKIYNTDLNTVSSVQSNNFITANSFADKGIGITRYKNLVVGFGDYSTEFFFNAGNASGSVLSRVKSADIRIGCIRRSSDAGRVFMPIGDSVYWIGFNPESGLKALYRLKSLSAEKVSSPTVDKILSASPTTGLALFIAGAFSLDGMTHLMIGITGQSSMLCYCLETNFWWRFTPGGNLAVSAILGGAGGAPEQPRLVTPSNSTIYAFSSPITPFWTDASSTYSMTVQTENMDMGTRKKKYWRSLSVIGDMTTSTLDVSYSDDDYSSFSASRSISPGVAGSEQLTRLGASRRRAWKLTHNTTTACRMRFIDIDYDEGTS